MYISCLIGFILIFLYCFAVTVKDGEMPNSISQMVYSLDKKWKWTFSAVLFAVAFMIVPQLMTAAEPRYTFLSFLTVGGILGVGADPLSKDEKNIVHYASAVVMGLATQALVFLLNPILLVTWMPYILYTLSNEDGNKNMFVGEMAMLLNTALLCLM